MSHNYEFCEDHFIFHPGYYLEENIKASGLSLAEYAKRSEVPEPMLADIVRGERAVDEIIAERLAKYTGASATFWLNLQRSYDIAKECEKIKEGRDNHVD